MHARVTPALVLPVMAWAGSQRLPSVTKDPPPEDGAGFELFVFTPFDHSNFLPDFVHVKVRLFEVTCSPDIVHFVPDFGAAALALVGVEISESAMKDEMIRDEAFFHEIEFIRRDYRIKIKK